MAHANAPLTPEGRRRLIDRIVLDGRPISHVADEAGVSRLTHEPIVAPLADRAGQLSLDLTRDNNVT